MGFFNAFNPFRNLYRKESKRHPHARTLRGGLLRKVKDTFEVFAGEMQAVKKKDRHIGVFDYATFFIPYVIERIFHWCNKTVYYNDWRTAKDYKEPSSFEYGLACVLYYPWFFLLHLVCNVILCNLLRKPFAALITGLASFIFIPAAEIFSWVVDKIYARKEKIYQLNVNYVKKKGQTVVNDEEKNNNSESMTSIKMLGALLSESAEDLDSIQVKYQHAFAKDKLSQNIIFTDLTKGHTTLFFDTKAGEFEDEYCRNQHDNGDVDYLYVFKEGIVYISKLEESDDDEVTPMVVQHFIMNADQYNGLSQSGDMKKELFSNPEKYLSPQLIFFRQNKNGTEDHIAYLQTDEQSLQDNHAPIQALLELNVGGMSVNFDEKADDTFKKEFPEETSRTFTITN